MTMGIKRNLFQQEFCVWDRCLNHGIEKRMISRNDLPLPKSNNGSRKCVDITDEENNGYVHYLFLYSQKSKDHN